MICKKCDIDKPLDQMFSRKSRNGGERTYLQMCKSCHKKLSGKGGKMRDGHKQGYIFAATSVTPFQDEVIYITWTNTPAKVMSKLRDVVLNDIFLFGAIQTKKEEYNNLLDLAENDLHKGKWYFATAKIKKFLNDR